MKLAILAAFNTNSRLLVRIWRSWGLVGSKKRKQKAERVIVGVRTRCKNMNIGKNWKTKTTGTIISKKGYFFIPDDTEEKAIRPIQKLYLNQGDSFQVIPFDSNVRFQPKSSNEIFGPFREMGSKQPRENDPLELVQERMITSDVELSEEIQNQLKSLGYMTEE